MLREGQGHPNPGDFPWSHTLTPGLRRPGLYPAQEWSQYQEMGAPGEHDPGSPSPSAGIPVPRWLARVWLGTSFCSSHPCHSQFRARKVINSRQPRDRHPVWQVAREVVCPMVTRSNQSGPWVNVYPALPVHQAVESLCVWVINTCHCFPATQHPSFLHDVFPPLATV